MKKMLDEFGFWLNIQLVLIGLYIFPQDDFFDSYIYHLFDKYFEEWQLGGLFIIAGSINIFLSNEKFKNSWLKVGFQGVATFCWLIQAINTLTLSTPTISAIMYSIQSILSLYLIVSSK